MCITCYNDIRNSVEGGRLYALAFKDVEGLIDWYWKNAGKFDPVSLKESFGQMLSKMEEQLGWGKPETMSRPRLNKYNRMKEQLADFAIKKNYQFTTLAKGLKDSGLAKAAFTEELKLAHEIYYKHWQEVEANQVRQVAHAKQQWEQIEQYSEVLPFLTYNSLNDDRVRPEHKMLDGITLRWDDPFWKNNMPPNGYNCRCFVTQDFEGEISTLTPEQQAFNPDKGFSKNWAANDEFFPSNHTYLQSKIEDTEEYKVQLKRLLE